MNVISKTILSCLWTIVAVNISLTGQILSGDANNDGIVNNIDILYIGYAFGSLGPARVASDSIGVDGTTFSEAILSWEENFPDNNTTNYLYADSDGNGFIDEEDFFTVTQNYNRNTSRTSSPTQRPAVFGIDPQLGFGEPSAIYPLTEESVVEIPVFLGNADISVESLNGLAFSVEFDSSAIQEVYFDFSNSWLNTDNRLFSFQLPPNSNENRFDAAITRYGQDPVNGLGQIGTISVVIEGDLIGFFEHTRDSAATLLKFKDIHAVDGNFGSIPIFGDSIQFMLYRSQIVSTQKTPLWSTAIKSYPNPVRDHLTIESPFDIRQVQCINALGQRIPFQAEYSNNQLLQVECSNLSPGTYILEIFTDKGVAYRPFSKQSQF